MDTDPQGTPRKKRASAKRLSRNKQPLQKSVPNASAKRGWFRSISELTSLQTHDLVTKGLRVKLARQLMRRYTIIGEGSLLSVLGITARTMQRRAASAHKTLDQNASDRAIRLASVTEQAIEVLGSQEAAERWLSSPAMALDRRRPIDLLQSSEGTELVKTLLTRMDYGVYA
jgi:putative toxin-antitoxin system antitoxin component (TIGR02293 family)